ncbi:MAG: alkanesulfonate monooxygenase SsuD [Gammaproteobacteria bacterium]|jgi:alkanesulfonate monooxygenase SsuD/methylene tetrahydromethanopterin reductase-like flavin-dependent oxidoreductase (luciferase family)
MKTWWFTENCYPHLPDERSYRSIRVSLPNANCDPEIASDLYNRYLDLWCACEEIGLEIMLNEHHQTATCMIPSGPIMLGILARETSTARLLILGNPLPNRSQPVRVAEEMALIDVISKGRLECGFVRSVPYEAAAANILPYRGAERLWEAHDLILKAWTTHDGPFNFEGRWYHHRQVNIWPRPYQQPHPPVWVTMGSAASSVKVAEHKHVGAVFLAGYPQIRDIYDGYRQTYLDTHGRHAPLDRLAYLGLCYVGENEREAAEGAKKLMWYMESNKVPPEFSNPPGYHSPQVSAQVMNGITGSGVPTQPKLNEQMAVGNMFAGTPDQVFEQIKELWEYSGGFGHMLIMGHAGFLSDEDAVKSMKLYSKEVYPRLKELTANADPAELWERSKAMPQKAHVDLGNFGVEFVR